VISDDLFEMANFSSRTTGLPSNIIVWCRTDPLDHGHSKYRIKITKDKDWAAIFTVGSNSKLVKNINNSLTDSEIRIITEWIERYSSLLIGVIDGKLDTAEFSYEIQRLKGM
jgi:hypothetical protein